MKKENFKIKKLIFFLAGLICFGVILATPMVAAEKSRVDYYLPYPGLLPGNFFYPLKMVRDKIWLFFTTNNLKRAELYLLFADKKMAAAQALMKEDKKDLATVTANKAEEFLEKAVEHEKKAKQKGQETKLFLEKFVKASLKHDEVRRDLEAKFDVQFE